jgi:thiol-disulfide isomerase/thioredoxin
MRMPERNIRTLRLAGAILVMLAGIWVGASMYSSRTAQNGATGHGPAAVRVPAGEASPPTESDVGDALTGVPTQMGAPQVPARLPNFSLDDRTGRATAITAWAGKSLVINFWATWCAPCRREIPLLKSLHGEWAGRGVEIVGIAVDYRDKVVAYADELKIPYPLLIGEQDALDVAAQFGVASPIFPFTVFTDSRGEVVTLYVGELHRPQADLILSVIHSVDENRVGLAQAKRSIAEGLHTLALARGN